MTDPLEQRLRDALEAYAQTVTPEDVDRAREQEFVAATEQVKSHSSTPWAWRAAAAGLAAAAVGIGALTFNSLSGPDYTTQADSIPAPTSQAQSGDPLGKSSGAKTLPDPSKTSAEQGKPSAKTAEPAPIDPDQSKSGGAAAPPAATPSEPQPEPEPQSPEPTIPSSEPTTEPSATPSASPMRRRAASTTAPEPAYLSVNVDNEGVDGTVFTWSAHASGRSSGAVSGYSVSYGDGTREAHATSPCGGGMPVESTDYYTGPQQHTYAAAGTYQVTVTVMFCAADGSERAAADSTTVTVP